MIHAPARSEDSQAPPGIQQRQQSRVSCRLAQTVTDDHSQADRIGQHDARASGQLSQKRRRHLHASTHRQRRDCVLAAIVVASGIGLGRCTQLVQLRSSAGSPGLQRCKAGLHG